MSRHIHDTSSICLRDAINAELWASDVSYLNARNIREKKMMFSAGWLSVGDAVAAQLFVIHRKDVDMSVDAVHQRSGYLRDVALNHFRSARTVASAVVKISARTRVHWLRPAGTVPEK